ncbi:MAG: hypothetical protein QOI11_1802 [Candidatus Eremiobacteraeota bacterium]|jgi:predicted nucleic acid-binding protein|nr:hypothetical protein [Candidatus Eremiobacteraeota bacterium]
MARSRLILDSGAVSAISEGDARALTWAKRATERGMLIGVPAPVFAETSTAHGLAATIHRAVRPKDTVLSTTLDIAVEAGVMRYRTRKTHATVDAIVVATAARYPGSIILTSDLKDIITFALERPDSRLTVRSV